METLAKFFANYIIKDSDLDYEVVKYGVDAILSTALCFSVALFCCFLLNHIIFGIFFILLLTPIKMQFLSYHCTAMHRCIMTYSLCTVSSLTIYNFIIVSNLHTPLFIYYLFMAILCFSVRDELNKHNIRFILFYLLISTLFYFLMYRLFLISTLTLLIEIILVLSLHIKNTKTCQNE